MYVLREHFCDMEKMDQEKQERTQGTEQARRSQRHSRQKTRLPAVGMNGNLNYGKNRQLITALDVSPTAIT